MVFFGPSLLKKVPITLDANNTIEPKKLNLMKKSRKLDRFFES